MQIITWQGGGRGFAENANKLFVVTTAVEAFGNGEYNEAFKVGGMHAMNLLYALHAYQIGACALNWKGEKNTDDKLRALLYIPDNEEIIIVIAAGYPPEEFTYVTSGRNKVDESLVIVK